jgi:DNA phosphorothioation-dependent restriction protein DptG
MRFGDDANFRVFRQNFLGAAVALDFAFDSQQASHLHNVAFRGAVLFGQVIDDELARKAADGGVVAMNISGVIRLQNVAFQADHRDVRLHRLPHDGSERGTLVRRDDQQVGLLANERFHLRDLFTVVLLRVGNHQLHAARLGK